MFVDILQCTENVCAESLIQLWETNLQEDSSGNRNEAYVRLQQKHSLIKLSSCFSIIRRNNKDLINESLAARLVSAVKIRLSQKTKKDQLFPFVILLVFPSAFSEHRKRSTFFILPHLYFTLKINRKLLEQQKYTPNPRFIVMKVEEGQIIRLTKTIIPSSNRLREDYLKTKLR